MLTQTQYVSAEPALELLPSCDADREAEGLTNGDSLVLINQLRGDLTYCHDAIVAYKDQSKKTKKKIDELNAQEAERVAKLKKEKE